MFLNAPKLQLLNVLFLVIEDVLPEGVSFQDLHVGSEADHKAPGTFQRVNRRPEFDWLISSISPPAFPGQVPKKRKHRMIFQDAKA